MWSGFCYAPAAFKYTVEQVRKLVHFNTRKTQFISFDRLNTSDATDVGMDDSV